VEEAVSLQATRMHNSIYLCWIRRSTQHRVPMWQYSATRSSRSLWEGTVRAVAAKSPVSLPSSDHQGSHQRNMEHEIELILGVKPLAWLRYRHSLPEEKLLREKIADLVEFQVPSSVPRSQRRRPRRLVYIPQVSLPADVRHGRRNTSSRGVSPQRRTGSLQRPVLSAHSPRCDGQTPRRLRSLGSCLYEANRLYEPQSSVRNDLLREAHDGPMSGHSGRDRPMPDL
jgi:hypothetical protein